MCKVDEEGKLLEIDPKHTTEDDILVPLDGYYEVFNEQGYLDARYDFDIKDWVGVGDPRPIVPDTPSDIETLKSDVDYLSMVNDDLVTKNEQQQADIDYLIMTQEV